MERSTSNTLVGKIYAGVVATHSSDDDFVVVQEAERRFGYMPPVFAAKATVAFPPICRGEVWTVGWVQALTGSSQMIACENDFVLVLVYMPFFKLMYILIENYSFDTNSNIICFI